MANQINDQVGICKPNTGGHGAEHRPSALNIWGHSLAGGNWFRAVSNGSMVQETLG